MAELQMDWADGEQIRTEYFHFPRRPQPNNARSIGRTVGGRNIVIARTNPIWTMQILVGPLAQAKNELLRLRVGEDVDVRIDIPERPLADYPDSELWVNADIEATLISARQSAAGMDITSGELFAITLQFAESDVS